MQFEYDHLRRVSLVILIQCLLLWNGYYHSIIFLQFLFVAWITFDFFYRKQNTESNGNQRSSSFHCSSSYDFIYIRPTTTAEDLDDAIFHLSNARKYSMTSKSNNVEHGQRMSLCIDASLPDRSLMIIIEYDHERDAHTSYVATLHDLFKVIFERTKFILGWGDLRLELQRLLRFELFTDTQLIQVRPIDVQRMFEEWHHRWLLNRSNESANIDDDSQIVDAWSIAEAIVFCFDQSLDEDDDLYGLNYCFGIGKISDFVRNPTK